jgi:hypothetical protein
LDANNKDETQITQAVKQSALRILFSIIGLSNEYKKYDTEFTNEVSLPPLPKSHSTKRSNTKTSKTSVTNLLSKETSLASFSSKGSLNDIGSSSDRNIQSNFVLDYTLNGIEPLTLTVSALNSQIKDILLSFIEEEKNPAKRDKVCESHAVMIWGISVLCFDELANNSKYLIVQFQTFAISKI